MTTATKYGPGDDPIFRVNNILVKVGYHNLLLQVSRTGFKGVSQAQKVALSEIARIAATHTDPRIRDHLTTALQKLHAAFFEYCLSLTSEARE